MIQENIEHSTFITSRRAANTYIRPILAEDSLIQTPSIPPKSPYKKQAPSQLLINNQSQSDSKIAIAKLIIKEYFEVGPDISQTHFQNIVNISSNINTTIHSLISIYSLTLLFWDQLSQLPLLRILSICVLICNYLLEMTLLWKQQSDSWQYLNAFFTQNILTLVLFIVSFIFPDYLHLLYIFVSLLSFAPVYKTIRILLLLIMRQDFKRQFIITEIFVLIYTIHLHSNLEYFIIHPELGGLTRVHFFLRSFNTSFSTLLFSFNIERDFLIDQVMISVNIIFTLSYYFSIFTRYQVFLQSNFNTPTFLQFMSDQIVQKRLFQLKLLQIIWKAYNLSNLKQTLFEEILEEQRINFYYSQIIECKKLKEIFTKPLLYELANSAQIIKFSKNEVSNLTGLSIIIEGMMKIRLSDNLWINKYFKRGDNFGITDLISSQDQYLQLECISDSCTILNITSQKFSQSIQFHQKDKETALFLKDQIIYSNNTQIIDQKCYICREYHPSIKCPIINNFQQITSDLLEYERKNNTNHRSLFYRFRQKRKPYLKDIVDSFEESGSSESPFLEAGSGDLMPPDKKIGQIYTSIHQMIHCSSKSEQEGQDTVQINLNSSNQVAESQSHLFQTNMQSFKILDQQHSCFNVDRIQLYQFYYPMDNADIVIYNVNENTKLQ